MIEPGRSPPRWWTDRANTTTVIEGDFDPADGPVSFPGQLVVKGDVPDRSEIEANDSIEIHGSVGAAVIRTHGDLSIGGGASGPGYISAGRDIRVRFAENSTLISGRRLIIEVSAMHSRLSAGRNIIITGEDGVLVGSVAKAGVSISAPKIGSRLYTPTTLQVGIPPLLRSEHKRLKSRISQIQQRRDAMQKNLGYLEHLDANNVSQKMAKRISKLPLMRFQVKHFSDAYSKYVKRYETLEQMIRERAKYGRVDSIKEIFPGVIITICWTTLELREHLTHVTFLERGGKVLWEPLDSANTRPEEEVRPEN